MTQTPIATTGSEFKRAAPWLEQGREIAPSAELLGQLADALLLTASERTHHSHQLDAPQLQAKRPRHAELGIVDLTYAPLRPRGVAGDLSVVVYSALQ